MLSYLFLYIFFSYQSLKKSNKLYSSSYYLLFILLSIFIGLRYQVGVDWNQYEVYLDRVENLSLDLLLINVEPGYMLLNWIGLQFGKNIFIVNYIASLIFLSGLLYYSKKQEYPWLSLLISFPILIIIVGLGYTRQACAIGFELFALISLERKNFYKSIILLSIGSLFHISLLPFLLLLIKKPDKNIFKIGSIVIFLIILTLGIFIYLAKFNQAFESYYLSYILKNYSSAGVIYRLIPSIIAALVLIYKRSKVKYLFGESANIYFKMSYLTIFFIIIVFLFPKNTTIIDRFALYLTPLPIYVFTKSIRYDFFKIKKININLILVITYFFYTFFWLQFAIHSKWFVPYKNILFF